MMAKTAILMLLLTALVGCADELEPVSTDTRTELLEWQRGLVLAESTNGQLEFSAQFVRAQGAEPEAVFNAFERWQPDLGLDADTCTVMPRLETDHSSYAVEFIDVGALTLRAADESTTIMGRRLPDYFHEVYGVLYEQSAEMTDAEYTLESTGGELSLFMTALSFPVAISPSVVMTADDMVVSWQSANHAMYLDVYGRDRVHCRLTDDGQFELPLSLLAGAENVTLRRATHQTIEIDAFGNVDILATQAAPLDW